MTQTHTYREQTAPELVSWFARLVGGHIIKGRDDRLISQYMLNNNVTPTQMLLGMFEFRNSTDTQDIPTFLRGDWPEGDDALYDEAELVLHLSGQPTPHFMIIYADLIDLDMADAGFEKSFQDAKAQLQQWVDDYLNRPPKREGRASGRK